ncbi:MAG: DUF1275 domain-containing protein [Myxococcaceae bacterium]|nr:DUF1275 domain-containing protein [Myxococcaceae bacterium]
MPLSNGRKRTFRQNVTLAVLLASVAGAVNAAGFFILGVHTSHMTGHTAAMGEALATGELGAVKFGASAVLAFMAGAATSAALFEVTAGLKRARHAPALAIEASVLGAAAVYAFHHPHEGRTTGLAVALSFAMGLQNALVTQISGAVVRTTHLTGVVTDLGIEIVAVVRAIGSRIHAGASMMESLRHFWVGREFERVGLHLALFAAFLTGGTIGPLLLLHSDPLALAAPGVVLVGLILFDLGIGPEEVKAHDVGPA